MTKFIPHPNRFLAFLGWGETVCERHGPLFDSALPCIKCWSEAQQRADEQRKNERIEEMAQAMQIALKRINTPSKG